MQIRLFQDSKRHGKKGKVVTVGDVQGNAMICGGLGVVVSLDPTKPKAKASTVEERAPRPRVKLAT